MKLDEAFYQRSDVVQISRDLLGMKLVTKFEGKLTAGIITETEAYAGITDRASHAYGGRRTSRTEYMYHAGGIAYVYLCYGIHSLFNVVTNIEGIPHAILIRSVFPISGVKEMFARRKANIKNPARLCPGPGTVSSALGIHYSHTGLSLMQNKIWIESTGIKVKDSNVLTTPRIGVDYAGSDALLPYRFILKGIDLQ